MSDEDFRQYILSLIDKPENKLSILFCTSLQPDMLSFLQLFAEINLKCYDLEIRMGVSESFNFLSLLPPLFVNVTNKLHFFEVHSMTVPHQVTVKHLLFSRCNELNMDNLASSSILSVSLHYCDGLNSIYSLSHLVKVEIMDCIGTFQLPNFALVSDLVLIGNSDIHISGSLFQSCYHLIKSLTISRAILSDVSFGKMKSLQSLNLSEIDNISDLLFVSNISSSLIALYLRLQNVSDLSPLQKCTHLKEVFLESMPLVNDLVSLQHILKITLDSLYNLTSLSGIGGSSTETTNQLSIIVKHCDKIQSFSCLRYVPTVEIAYCSGFSDIKDVGYVKNLRISRCDNFHSFQPLMNGSHGIQALTLAQPGYKLKNITETFSSRNNRLLDFFRVNDSKGLQDLVSVETIPCLIIYGYPLKSLKGIGKNHKRMLFIIINH
jgi:hypothetical protein